MIGIYKASALPNVIMQPLLMAIIPYFWLLSIKSRGSWLEANLSRIDSFCYWSLESWIRQNLNQSVTAQRRILAKNHKSSLSQQISPDFGLRLNKYSTRSWHASHYYLLAFSISTCDPTMIPQDTKIKKKILVEQERRRSKKKRKQGLHSVPQRNDIWQ